LPEPLDVSIDEKDLLIETMRARRRWRPACEQNRKRDPHDRMFRPALW